ncbi:MAG: Do family serine endopeptidase [Calditrichaeota bacterium]|nr:Do family serine endopeptidase [Calditrichota bacterium]
MTMRKLGWIGLGFVLVGAVAGVLFTANMNRDTTAVAQNVAPPVNVEFAQYNQMINDNGESPFVAVAERVGPTVVNISSDKVVSGNSMNDMFNDSPFFEFFHKRDGNQQQPRKFHSPATGSGMIISRDGFILTNNHVVEDADKVTVKTQDGTEYEARIIGADPETDVAVIKIDHNFAPNEVALIGNSDQLHVGDWAIAMGNPLGLDWTLTVGIVSARGRSNLAIAGGGPAYQDFIQTDASINFGNSGGPLCNIHGEVIGVNTAINPSGQGIGFAIPINMAMKVVDQLRENGKVARGYLGMLPRELTADLRSATGMKDDQNGVFVERVDPNTPAEEGGLEAGDVITEFNGNPVNDVQHFRMRVADVPPGKPVQAKILREGKTKNLEFVLGDRAQLATFMGQSKPEPEPSTNWLGIDVGQINESMARALKLDGTFGVIINEIDEDSPAQDKLREGDVIIEIDRKPVDDVKSFKEIAADLRHSDRAVLFRIVREGVKTFEAVEVN